mmetsp:Transcript_5200/g.3909  ORF Transcript_5200/g.3909 Transcript_5200/m.3909 type:complete len:106 (-) Transcript_5200:1227-1544(-)
MWHRDLDANLQENMFTGDLDKPLSVKIIDLPNLHKYDNKWADYFLKNISITKNIQLFANRSAKAIVELKWPKVYKGMNWYLFYPYLILLFMFLYYSVFIFENYQK